MTVNQVYIVFSNQSEIFEHLEVLTNLPENYYEKVKYLAQENEKDNANQLNRICLSNSCLEEWY